MELCERRNLLTHTGGVVSAQYINACREHGCLLENTQIGQKLDISPKYYRSAVQIIREFGMKLIQVIWRKLVETEIDAADRELNGFAYRLIYRRRYGAAATMLRFGLYEMKKHGSDSVRKMMVVNYANSVKLNGDKAESEKILDAEDWSACTDNYRICVAAIKGENRTVIDMMKSVVDSGKMRIADFREWPVFETVRSDPEFASAFEEQFGEKLLIDTETSNVKIADTISDVDSDATDPEPSQKSETIH